MDTAGNHGVTLAFVRPKNDSHLDQSTAVKHEALGFGVKYHYTRGMKLNLISPSSFIARTPFSNAPWTLPLCKNGRVWRSLYCKSCINHNDCLSIVKGDAQDDTVLGVYCRGLRDSPKVEHSTHRMARLTWLHVFYQGTSWIVWNKQVNPMEERKVPSTILSGKLLPPKLIISFLCNSGGFLLKP